MSVSVVLPSSPRASVRPAPPLSSCTGLILRISGSLVLFFIFLFCWSNQAQAATCTWTGSSSTDWNTPANWSACGGNAPTSADSVTIADVTNDPVVGADATVAGLTLNGGLLTINSGQNLTVTGLSTLAASFIGGSGRFTTAQLNLNAGCCGGGITLGAELTVGQALTVTAVNQVNGSVINVLGTLRADDADLNGTTIFRLAGSSDQTLSGSGRLHNLDIAKPSGNILLPTNININGGTFTGTGSRFVSSGGLLIFGSEIISYTGSIDDAALNAGCCGGGITLNSDLTINNRLLISDVNQVNGKVITIGGDLRSNDADLNGTTVYRLVGTGDQTLSGSGRINNLHVLKPSGNVLLPANFNINGGTFTGNSSRFVSSGGLLIFGSEIISYTGSIDDAALNAGCCGGGIILNADLTINNRLLISDVNQVNGSVITIGGDLRSNDADLNGTTVYRLVGTGDQTLSGSGRINNLHVLKPSGNVLLPANFNINGGTFTGTGSRFVNSGGLLIFGSELISYTGSIDDVALNAGCCGGGITLNTGLTINNRLLISDVNQVNGSVITIGGDLRSNDADLNGTTVYRLVGTGDQTLSGSGRINNLDVLKPSGNVLLPANFNINGGTFTGTGSRFVNSGGLLIFGSELISYTGSIDDAALNAGCCGGGIILNADLTINNRLLISDVNQVNGSAINIGGDLRANDADLNGTTVYRLVGTGDQTLSGSGRINNLDVLKPSGNILLPANFNINGGTFTGTGSRFVSSGGLLIFGSELISYTGSIDDAALNAGCCGGGITLNADLAINNRLLISDVNQVNGSAINIGGDLQSNDADLNGTTVYRLVGTGDQNLLGTGRVNNLEVAKSGGRVLFTGNRSFVTVLVSNGLFEPNGFAVTAPVTVNGGRLGGQGVIIGNVTANSGGAINAGTAPGTTGQLGIQGNLVLNSGSRLVVDVNGNTPGSQYDQVVVTGTVTINSAIITGTTDSAPSTPLAILLNDSSDSIAGARFSNAPNTGDAVTLGSATYQLAYNGSSGNDLTLTLPPPTGLQVHTSSPTPLGAPTVFTATLATGSTISYTWNFGDGSPLQTSAAPLISYTYGSIANYLVTVMASNAQGTISTTVPVTITPSGQVVEAIAPGTAKSLVYNSPDGAKVTIQIPAGAITQSLYLVYNTVNTPTPFSAVLTFGQRAFRLEAWLGSQLLPGLTFATPLTLTLDYLASDVSGLNEQQLAIYYFDTVSNQWRADGVTVVTRDPLTHRLVVQLHHLTEFALFQPKLPPLVMNDADLALINTPLHVSAPGVLANDSDPEGGNLSAQLATPPLHGAVALATNGGFVYTPTLHFTGMDSFQYAVTNGFFTVTGTVTINVFQPGSGAGPLVLPTAGWNLFGYPLAASRPVTEVLASLTGVYTTVFGYDATTPSDPWLMYDPSIPAPFDAILNRLKTFDYGHGYWINLRQPATITLSSTELVGMSTGSEEALLTPQPPATVYGEVTASASFVPRAGLQVTAEIAGVTCGQSQTQTTKDGRIFYALHVLAAGSGAQQACGHPGETVTLRVDGRLLTTLPWSNAQSQRVQTTQPVEQSSGVVLYLPLIAKR